MSAFLRPFFFKTRRATICNETMSPTGACVTPSRLFGPHSIVRSTTSTEPRRLRPVRLIRTTVWMQEGVKNGEISTERKWLNRVGLTELPAWSSDRNGNWDQVQWKDDQDATEYINEMLLKDGDRMWEDAPTRGDEEPTGFKKLNLEGYFYGNDEDQSLYVPAHIHGVYTEAMDLLKKGRKALVAIIGPPGIGKSFGLRWALLELAKTGNTVVLESALHRVRFLFVPIDGGEKKYTAYSVDISVSPGIPVILQQKDAWLLFDPADAVSPHRMPAVRAKSIIAASPDTRHYEELVKHRGTKLMVPPWTHDELIGAWRLGMGRGELELKFDARDPGSAIDWESIIRERADAVGGLPRYVLCSTDVHTDRLAKVEAKLKAISERSSTDFCGQLSVETDTWYREDPPSVVLHARSKNIPEILNGDLKRVDNSSYAQPSTVQMHNSDMLRRLYVRSYKHVVDRFNYAAKEDRLERGAEFEQLVDVILSRPMLSEQGARVRVLLVAVKDGSEEIEELIVPEGLFRKTPKDSSWNSALDELVGMGHVLKDLRKIRKIRGNSVLRAIARNNPVWDFALGPNVLLNVTGNPKHSLPAGRLRAIIERLDAKDETKDAEVHLLWVTPPGQDWVIIAKPEWSGSNPKDLNEWDDIFAKRVRQHTVNFVVLAE